MNLCKYVLLKNLKERLDYIVYHNDILINSIYYNINTTESIYTQKHLLKEIQEINLSKYKIENNETFKNRKHNNGKMVNGKRRMKQWKMDGHRKGE